MRKGLGFCRHWACGPNDSSAIKADSKVVNRECVNHSEYSLSQNMYIVFFPFISINISGKVRK